jgi:Podovirus DNA encapsidation protein (Gp16).
MGNITFEKSAYYNFDKIYSMNGVYNFVVGLRGVGKTYGKKVKCVKAAIEKGHEFIYLRRYKEELKAAKGSFFNDFLGEFPDYDFQVSGNVAQYSHKRLRDEKKRPWFTLGYFMCLSQGQTFKSVPFPLVRHIIYDEFILEKGMTHYLPDEASVFTNFFNTVDRSKDKTRAWFLANAVSIDNPYFLKYEIEPKVGEEWIRRFAGKNSPHFVVAHFPDPEQFKAQVNRTRFGEFINESDPTYAAYAIGNEFKDNNNNLLEIKPSSAEYVFTLETKKGTFSVWRDWGSKSWYIQEKRPKTEIVFTIVPENMGNGKKLLFNNDRQISVLRAAFKSHLVYFDKAQTRVALLEIFKR